MRRLFEGIREFICPKRRVIGFFLFVATKRVYDLLFECVACPSRKRRNGSSFFFSDIYSLYRNNYCLLRKFKSARFFNDEDEPHY